MVPRPILQALVLADQVYTDAASGKKIIAGTFNRLWAKSFPKMFSRPTFAYICLTEVQGTVNLVLRYVDLSESNVLMQLTLPPLSADNPLDSVELAIQVPPFPMPHEGVYAFELYAEKELIGARRIRVTKQEPKRSG